jgi:type IV secretion system protein VirD4
MTAKTTTAPAKPGRHWGLRLLTAGVAVLLLALVLHMWVLAGAVAVTGGAAGWFAARVKWARYKAGGRLAARRRARHEGWATSRDVARARRAEAKLTRRICPGAPLLELGSAGREAAAVSPECSVLVIGPPGYWKSSSLACMGADAPGLLLTTSTKTSLMLDIHPYRKDGRDTWVLNADGYGGIPSNLAWNPVEFCDVPTTAMRRAGDLMDAAPHDPSGKDSHWDSLSKDLLQFLLRAAALGARYPVQSGVMSGEAIDLRTVRFWSSSPAAVGTAIEILESVVSLGAHGEYDDWAVRLQGMALTGMANEKYWEAVAGGAGRALAWLDDPVMAAAACPPPGEGFSVRDFARSRDSLHLIGKNRGKHGSIAPYVAALVMETFEQIKHYAMETPSGRLPVPARFVLDEFPLTAPAGWHDILAESREPLAQIILACQTIAQLRAKYGADNADTIRSACPAEVFTGGEKRHQDLTAVSEVAGEVDTWHGDMTDLRREKLLTPGALQQLAKGKAVIFLPECKPVLADLPAIWKRRGHKRATAASFPAARPQGARPAASPAPARTAVPSRMQRLIPTPVQVRPPLREAPARLAIEPPRRAAIPMPGAPASIPGHLRRPVASPDPVPALAGKDS